MKIVYILLGVAILAALIVSFTGSEDGSDELNSQTADENAALNTDSDSAVEDSDVEADDTVAPGDESEMQVGSDVGMEFPDIETDADVDVSVEGAEKAFTVDAFNFGYSMDEIRVSEGDVVTITLTNSDGFHDFVVDEFDAASARIQAGDTTTVTFVADQAGTYEYYCSVGNHRDQGMIGTLVVE